jgi:Flp pilus assembly protein TadD
MISLRSLLAAVLGMTALACGRADPPGKALPVAATAAPAHRPVYFIGLDGADWEMLDPLIASGAMPNLARLAGEGSSGVLETEHPTLSPLLWTTMMTGVSPLEHRILDFTGFSPDGVREPIRSDERRAPAVWSIASWSGRKIGVFGLWATYPAENVHGVVVSDRFSSFLGPRGSPPEGAVFPASFASVASAARERIEQGLGLPDLRRFLFDLEVAELERAKRATNPYSDPIAGLRRMVAETRLQDELFRDFVSRAQPDLAILYLESTDTAGHLFAPFLPPRPESTPAAEYGRFHTVPEAYFRWIDELLGTYSELAAKSGAVLFIASDHGFHWRENRPARASSFANATAAKWHRKEGIYVLHGPGIPPHPRAREAQGIRRVAATILALAGLAPGQALASPPLSPVVASPLPAEDYGSRFRSELRSRKPVERASTPPAAEELAKLQALGYLGASEPVRIAGAGSTRSPGSFNNEGLILRAEGRGGEARAAFERALALDPRFASAEWNLSELLWEAGDEERADELLLSALGHDLGDGATHLAARVAMRLERGGERLRGNDCAAAADDFARVAALDSANAAAPAAEGLAHLCLGDETAAAQAFRRSLALDPQQPEIAEALNRLGTSSPY